MASNLKKALSLIWNYGIEYSVTGLLGFIPTPIGSIIRNLFYTLIFQRIGFMVYIQPDVRLIGAKHLQLGNRVRIYKGSYVSSRGNPITLKDDVHILQGVNIRSGSGFQGGIEIGERTMVGCYVCIGGRGPVKIGQDCMIASHSSLYANNHNYEDVTKPINQQGVSCKGIVIEDNCWIGAGVRIIDGVTIGTGSVIGAGAVVTRDIPPYSVAVGVPAAVVKRYHPAAKHPSDHPLDGSEFSVNQEQLTASM
jgi:acetyltransferase-like isoleucine patch superfamily enzyme